VGDRRGDRGGARVGGGLRGGSTAVSPVYYLMPRSRGAPHSLVWRRDSWLVRHDVIFGSVCRKRGTSSPRLKTLRARRCPRWTSSSHIMRCVASGVHH
jgi:hypothetical protein